MSELNLAIYHDAGFSTQQMRNLQVFLEQNPLHWITLSEGGIYEMVLDNQMMSDYRACHDYFIEAHVRGMGFKSGGASWYLQFGIWFHEMMRIYYTSFRESTFDMEEWAIKTGRAEWDRLELDNFKDHKEYKSIGAFLGAMGLLVSYATRFSAENERIRVIGTEISFGHKREVHLGDIDISVPCDSCQRTPHDFEYTWLRCYLSGRIDLLVDTGDYICPLDHKTRGSFRFDPALEYEMEEGPTGYIYATKKILSSFLRANDLEGLARRSTNKIIMNFISKAIPSEGRERFKRLPIYKTDEQLEAYRLRMLATHEEIFRDLIRFSSGLPVSRDTSKCTQWHMHECNYFYIHRQNSAANEELIRISNYEKKEIWNTEEH